MLIERLIGGINRPWPIHLYRGTLDLAYRKRSLNLNRSNRIHPLLIRLHTICSSSIFYPMSRTNIFWPTRKVIKYPAMVLIIYHLMEISYHSRITVHIWFSKQIWLSLLHVSLCDSLKLQFGIGSLVGLVLGSCDLSQHILNPPKTCPSWLIVHGKLHIIVFGSTPRAWFSLLHVFDSLSKYLRFRLGLVLDPRRIPATILKEFIKQLAESAIKLIWPITQTNWPNYTMNNFITRGDCR